VIVRQTEQDLMVRRHLPYVACTRARDHLPVTTVDAASEFLDDFRNRSGASGKSA
jgi:hypothetical protein